MKRWPLLVQLQGLIFFLFMGIWLAVGALYYHNSATLFRRTLGQEAQQTIQQSSHFIETYLQKLEDTASALAQSDALRGYVRVPHQDEHQGGEALLASSLAADSDLTSITVVSQDGRVLSTSPEISLPTSSDMMQEAWYQDALEQGGHPVLVPAHQEMSETNRDRWVISLSQAIKDTSGQTLGVLRLDIDYKRVSNYLDQLQLGDSGFAFIVNSQHHFVYHPKPIVYSSQKEMSAMSPYLEAVNTETSDGRYFVSQVDIGQTDWTLIGVSSLEGLAGLKRQVLQFMLVILALGLVLSLLVSRFLLQKWIRPLQNLQTTMGEVALAQTDTPIRAKEEGSQEVYLLAQEFNHMLDQLEKLGEEKEVQQARAYQFELKALSGQINPHFLYNTLDSIVWSAEFQDQDKVVAITKALADYFRLALNKGKEIISLGDEVQHIRHYLYLQQVRYGDRLQYGIDLPEGLAHVQVPKLILQPLVENAIYHGIKPKNSPGHIEVKAEQEGHFVVLSVQDDGLGFPKEVDSGIQDLPLSGVGLPNVDERLRLYFGPDYHMEILSHPDEGTRIELYLPLNGHDKGSED